jgi:hypothetical protein
MTETGYALIRDSKIDGLFGSLPGTYLGISGFNTLSDAQAKTYGFIPYTYEQAVYSGYTHKLGETIFTLTTDNSTLGFASVKGVRQIIEYDAEMKEELRLNAIKSLDATLVRILRDTDWTLLSDCELDQQDIDAYAELRSETRATRLTLDSLSIEDIATLVDEYQTQSMLDLQKEVYGRSSAVQTVRAVVEQEKADKAMADAAAAEESISEATAGA